MHRKPKPLLRKLSEYESLELQWLWYPYIALGVLTIVEGDPNVGKSYLLMYLAALMTIGGKLPNGERLEKRDVFYLSAEDSPEYTVRPRIEAMGGDPKRIWFPNEPFTFSQDRIEELDDLLSKGDVGLVIVDTLFSYMPDDVDTSKPAAIRERLHAIQGLAEKHECAVLIIRHWTKSDRGGKAIYRGSGMMDIVAVARAGITIAKHPDDPKLRVMAHMKHNLSEEGESYAFELIKSDTEKLPTVVFQGKIALSADELESGTNDLKAIDEATAFLKEELERGEQPAEALKMRAEAKSISERTLDRAKKLLKVRTKKRGPKWYWSLRKSSD